MPSDGGRYEPECVELQERLIASGVVLIVIQGERGSGISVRCDDQFQYGLPDMLESIARDLRAELRRAAN